MQYEMNTTASGETVERIAEREGKMLIRIFHNGKYINYLFRPTDVTNLGLSTIFEMIDPDPEFLQAQQNWEKLTAEPVLKKKPHRKNLAA